MPATQAEQSGTDRKGRGTIPRAISAALEWLKTNIHQTLDTVGEVGAAARRTLDHWLDTIAESVTRGGASTTAALRAIDAALTGKNPIWAAIKGLVSGLSRTAQIALVLLIVLGLLLGPVLLVLALLALLVAGLAAAGRAAGR